MHISSADQPAGQGRSTASGVEFKTTKTRFQRLSFTPASRPTTSQLLITISMTPGSCTRAVHQGLDQLLDFIACTLCHTNIEGGASGI